MIDPAALAELPREMETRVRLMAAGNPKWDLSPNDIAALNAMLAELATLRGIVGDLAVATSADTFEQGIGGLIQRARAWKEGQAPSPVRLGDRAVSGSRFVPGPSYSGERVSSRRRPKHEGG